MSMASIGEGSVLIEADEYMGVFNHLAPLLVR